MRHARRHGLPTALLALMLGLALLIPEAGHSLAHHESAAHGAPRDADHHGGGADGRGRLGARAEGDHPHVELAAPLPARPSLMQAIIVRVGALLAHDLAATCTAPLMLAAGLPPGDLTLQPPPPARAPPLV